MYKSIRLAAVPLMLALWLAACGGSAPTYVLGGSISGLGAGKGISLSEAVSGQTLSLTSNGSFAFANELPRGASYKVGVTVNPAAQGCVVKNGEGTVGDGDVLDVEVLCGDSGTLDASFASGGKLVEPLMVPPREVNALALSDAGKILAAGSYYNGSNLDFALLRTDADGAYDSAFASGGKLQLDFGSDSTADVLALADGGAAVAGGNDGNFALLKVTAAGAVDASFGSNGLATADFGGGSRGAVAAFTMDDGGFLLVGGAFAGGDYRLGVLRLSAAGQPLSGFGANGKAFYAAPSGWSVLVVQDAVRVPDGKIVVVGYVNTGSDNDVWLARLNADGTLDTGFGNSGWTSFDHDGDEQYARKVAVQADGKLVIVARNNDGSDWQLFVARTKADGTLDASFDGDGLAFGGFGGDYDDYNAVAVQADGKIVVAGRKGISGSDDMLALARYQSDGSLDASFGDGGKAVFDLGLSETTYANDLLIQPDGRILVGGSKKGDALLIVRVWP